MSNESVSEDLNLGRRRAAMTEAKRANWEKYALAWKETSRERKLAALRESVVPSCTYRDPNTVAEGHEELVAYMLGFQQQVPGAWFDTTYFLAHHDRSIAKWNMVGGTGQVIGDGVSYAEYDERGLLVTMSGFFEPASS
jgi:hypothetical protein